MRALTHDDPVLVLLHWSDEEVGRFAVEGPATRAALQRKKDVTLPDTEMLDEEYRGITLTDADIDWYKFDESNNMITVKLQKPGGAPVPVVYPMLDSRTFLEGLKAFGYLPANVRRVVIDATANMPVLLYYDCIADERLLSAFRGRDNEVDIKGAHAANNAVAAAALDEQHMDKLQAIFGGAARERELMAAAYIRALDLVTTTAESTRAMSAEDTEIDAGMKDKI